MAIVDANKLKALEGAMAQIEKSFGKGAIMKLGDNSHMKVETISTGSLKLNIALGVNGLPKGRIIEIYGPESSGKTTLSLHACAEVQKQGGTACIIDAEHALDPIYAKALGVDVENLIVAQPDTGEQGLEIAEALVRSGGCDILVIDSVAALVPKAEIEGEMGDSHIGLQARLMSQALRKLAGIVNKTGCIVIFINQLREKVGVMFGCLHSDTLVNFTDGRSIPIRNVVEQQIEGNVWSYNEKTKEFEEKRIIDWHYNGDVLKNEDYIHFETNAVDHKGGVFGFTVTPNHKIFTNTGWKEAKNVLLSDKILSKYTSKINNSLSEFLWGSFIGDSNIFVKKNTATYRLQDNENSEYLNWKLSKVSPLMKMKKDSNRYISEYSSELKIIKDELGNRNPLIMLENHFSELGLAIWFMDDGHYDDLDGHCRTYISVKRFKNNNEFGKDIEKAFKKIGLDARYVANEGNVRFNKENTLKLFKMIYKYIPPCMQYKIAEEFRDKYEDFELENSILNKNYFVSIRNIRYASDRQMRQKGKYDISIEDNHNYLVGGKGNGIIVHNSPEVTTGGKALKFYATIRLDIRKIDTIKQGDQLIGNRVRVKIVKNKVAPPFKLAEFDIMYGKGIDNIGEIIDIGVEKDIIKKSGAWFSYGEERLGQGRENAKSFIADNDKIRAEIESKIKGNDDISIKNDDIEN